MNKPEWYPEYLRLTYAESPAVKQRFLEAAEVIEQLIKENKQLQSDNNFLSFRMSKVPTYVNTEIIGKAVELMQLLEYHHDGGFVDTVANAVASLDYATLYELGAKERGC